MPYALLIGLPSNGASPMAPRVKNPPAIQETQRVPSLGREDPLEEGMATTPGFLPGESGGQRSRVGCSPWGRTETQLEADTHTHDLNTHTE